MAECHRVDLANEIGSDDRYLVCRNPDIGVWWRSAFVEHPISVPLGDLDIVWRYILEHHACLHHPHCKCTLIGNIQGPSLSARKQVTEDRLGVRIDVFHPTRIADDARSLNLDVNVCLKISP